MSSPSSENPSPNVDVDSRAESPLCPMPCSGDRSSDGWEFAEWQQIAEGHGWRLPSLNRDQMIQTLQELLQSAETGNLSNVLRKKGFHQEHIDQRVQTIRQWVVVWSENKHAPLPTRSEARTSPTVS